MKILLSGCCGAMGQKTAQLIKEEPDCIVAVGIDKNNSDNCDFPVFDDFVKCNTEADVIIDFSHPSMLKGLLDYAVKNNMPAVLCTTGYSDEQKEEIKKASSDTAIFMSQNMSQGINLLAELVAKAASFLSDFDIEIVEKHHNKKVDAPSGTAYMLADAVMKLDDNKKIVYGRKGNDTKRQKDEIGIHSVRGGTIVGEHSVSFIGNDEVIEINHIAYSKNIFAKGAIKAAKFIQNKKNGLYDMKKMLESK